MAREGPSAETGFDYPALVREAFLGLVKGLLHRVAEQGLPGEHHFFLTFATRAEGVSLPPRLLARFPQEMTIVLQHQFWNLTVSDAAFAVTVRFGGQPERLTVPFEALSAFVDPSTGFGLRLAPEPGGEPDAPGSPGQPGVSEPAAPAKTPEVPAAASGPAAKVVDFGAYKRRDDEAG